MKGDVSTARILGASLVGTAVEFYDFYIYATAASLVLGPLFFPTTSAKQLAAYGSFALAFMARPIGAIAFGHFGDRIGRKSTLVTSLVLMGVCTVAIGLLPTYADIGRLHPNLAWLAPLTLCILRFGQGFGLGGEWGGAALLAVENAPVGYRARYGMFPPLGAPVGFIAANGLFLCLGLMLTPQQFQAWGWRLPFVISIILVALGLWVRLRLTETPAFAAALAREPPAKVPLAEVMREHPRELVAGTFAVVACYAVFYLATVFSLGYCVDVLGYGRSSILGVQLGAILFMAAGTIAAGYWSDKTSPRRVLICGCVATVALGALFGPMLGSGSLFVIWLLLSLALLVMGFVYGPLGPFLPSLFPARVRYTGVSFAFNVGGILGGGLAPIVASYLAAHGGLALVGLYLAGAAVISLVALAAVAPQAERG